MLFVPAVSATADEVAAAVADTAMAVGAEKPTLAVVMSSEGVPEALRGSSAVAAFAYPESAARALGRVAERADWLRRPQGAVPELEGIDRAAARDIVERSLERRRRVTRARGRAGRCSIRRSIVAERTAASVEEALSAAHGKLRSS